VIENNEIENNKDLKCSLTGFSFFVCAKNNECKSCGTTKQNTKH